MASSLARKILGGDAESPPSPTSDFRVWRQGENAADAAGQADWRRRRLQAQRERLVRKLEETDRGIADETAVIERQRAAIEAGPPRFDDLRREVEDAVRRLDTPAPDTREGREQRRAQIGEVSAMLHHLMRAVAQDFPSVHRELLQLRATLDRILDRNQR